MRSFIVFLCLVPTLLFARQTQLETQLKEAIKGKKAEIGIAVIIDGKDTITVNNDIHYPLMSVFKFHQALALADYMGKQKQSLETPGKPSWASVEYSSMPVISSAGFR